MRWLPALLVTAVAMGVGLLGGPLGPPPAVAAETASGSCSAGGLDADVAVKYRRAGGDLFVGGVALKIDESAGSGNRVRLVVKRDGRSAFDYTTRRDITAGPYTFDYQGHPIRIRGGSGEIRIEVTVDFDAEDSPRCTAVARIRSTSVT